MRRLRSVRSDPSLARLSRAAVAELLDGAEVLVARRDGSAKVLRMRDGRIAKRISADPCGNALDTTPRAVRFVRHAERLAALGVRVPTNCRAHAIDGESEHLLVYQPIPGVTLRDAASDPARVGALSAAFAAELARLHDVGVVFRAGHLANYIVGDDGGFGLIDVHALSIVRGPVSVVRRARSFRIVLKDARDRAVVAAEGGVRGFLSRYRVATRQGPLRGALVAGLVRAMHPTARAAWCGPEAS